MNTIRILVVAAAAAIPLAAGAAEVSPTWYGRGGTVVGPQPERTSPAKQGEQRIMQSRGSSLVIYKAKPAAQAGTVAERAPRSTGG
jgi:hypothetical protein